MLLFMPTSSFSIDWEKPMIKIKIIYYCDDICIIVSEYYADVSGFEFYNEVEMLVKENWVMKPDLVCRVFSNILLSSNR